MRNLAEEYVNEEDEEFKDDTSEINDTNKSKISKGKTEEYVIRSLLAKTILLKLTQAVIFFIFIYKQDMIAVGEENKKIKVNTNKVHVEGLENIESWHKNKTKDKILSPPIQALTWWLHWLWFLKYD